MNDLCLSGDVSINGLVLNTVDDEGVTWVLEDLDGWWTLPESSLPDFVRPVEYDGSYDAEGRYQSRLITVRGRFIPPPSDAVGSAVADARERLLRAVALARKTGYIVVQESPPKQAEIRLSGQPKISTTKKNGTTEFEIGFKASDPRKYAATSERIAGDFEFDYIGRSYDRTYDYRYVDVMSLGNSINAYNEGSYNTPAAIRFSGPVINPGIEHVELDKRIKFSLTLERGEYLELDLMEHSVLFMGTANRRYTMTLDSSWFMLESGDNTLRYLGVAPSADPDASDIDVFSESDVFPGDSSFPGLPRAEMIVAYRPAWL